MRDNDDADVDDGAGVFSLPTADWTLQANGLLGRPMA